MANEFEQHLMAKKLSEKTIKRYMAYLKLFEKECGAINQRTINGFINKHQSNVTRAFLKNLFEYFEQDGFKNLPTIPKVKGREQRLKKDLVSADDLIKIRDWLEQHANKKFLLMFDLTISCGLRREEVVTITKDSFYWNTWEEGKGMRLKVYAKGKERIVVIPSALAKRFVQYYIEIAGSLLEGDTFFKVQEDRWHKVFKKAVKEVNIKNVTLHDLRRKRATDWLENGVDIDEVRRRLGHSALSTTQKYLIRNEEDRLKKWEEQ